MSRTTLSEVVSSPVSKASAEFGLETSFLHSQEAGFPALSDSASCSSTESAGVTSTELRAMLASSMSCMYRQEVPLYGTLLSIISQVNSDVILEQGMNVSEAEERRISVERHGAIRVGTPLELHTLARIFAVFGMSAVGYYDLHKHAGLPIHATAFRPVDGKALERNPFRIFCSLLRMDLIKEEATRTLAHDLLSRRRIFSQRCLQLLLQIETSTVPDLLARETALEFVDEVVDVFRWHSTTLVSSIEYQKLQAVHPLVADIVSFRGPHINHLTPRTLDIDRVQQLMLEQGIDAKEVIEGPPLRKHAIYLRQTSFHALSEQVTFIGDGVQGRHKARFGEIESRGQALTRKGARLFDELMAQVSRTSAGTNDYQHALATVFQHGFPDDLDVIRTQGLGYFVYSVEDANLARRLTAETTATASSTLSTLVRAGAVRAEPLTYEDFLPASAAGIFQSNLPSSSIQLQAETSPSTDSEAQSEFESAIGSQVLDYFELYQSQQDASLRHIAQQLDCPKLLF